MKKAISLLILAASLFAFLNNALTQTREHFNQKYNFTIVEPEGWKILNEGEFTLEDMATSLPGEVVLALVKNDESQPRFMIIVGIIPNPGNKITPETYVSTGKLTPLPTQKREPRLITLKDGRRVTLEFVQNAFVKKSIIYPPQYNFWGSQKIYFIQAIPMVDNMREEGSLLFKYAEVIGQVVNGFKVNP